MTDSRIVLTANDIIDVPSTGRANIYVKADGTLALRDSTGTDFVMMDNRFDLKAINRRLLMGRTRITAAQAAGQYWFTEAATLVGTGIATPLAGIYIDPADFPTIAGKAALLNLKVQLYTNDVAPGSNFTIGLYPVTRPSTSGGSGVLIYSPGTVLTGSTVAFNTPAADGAFNGGSGDFAIPAAGHYALGFVTNAAIATSAHVHLQFQLNTHN